MVNNRTKMVNIFYQIVDNIPKIMPKNETCSVNGAP